MAWQDRIREGAYTSPSGTRQTFLYEDVTEAVDKRTSAHQFPDAEGTYVQDLGASGRRYPLRLFFSGDDYDLEAKAFMKLLLERGTGKLDHPAYGSLDVVPFGTIERKDALKSAGNQAIIAVIFWETIGLVYPQSQTDPASEVAASVEEYNVAAAAEFDATTNLESATQQAEVKNNYSQLLSNAEAKLQKVADTQADVQAQFDAVVDSINQGIDVLISDPLTLGFQTTIGLQSPARALTSIEARLTAYADLAESIITGDGAVVGSNNDPNESAAFHTRDLFASTYVTGSVVSAVNNQFTRKTEALEAAEDILAQFEAVAKWRDDNYDALAEVDTGEAYQKLLSAVSITAGFLVEISFTLKQELRLIIENPRTILDLAAELYGTADDDLDFLISSNDLTGDEILELPRGKQIVYYV